MAVINARDGHRKRRVERRSRTYEVPSRPDLPYNLFVCICLPPKRGQLFVSEARLIEARRQLKVHLSIHFFYCMHRD